MRLLVTRPQPDADATAARLRALGHESVVVPLLATEFLRPGLPGATPAAIAVSSRNGVRALGAWPEAAAWCGLPLFAVGDATAREARSAGFAHVASAGGDGAALAALVLRSFDPAAGPLLYAAAETRSPVFEETLRRRGFRIETVVAYRAVPAERLGSEVASALAAGGVEGVLLHSASAARTFRDIVAAQNLAAIVRRLTIYAISNGTADVLDRLAPAALLVAASPDEDALLRLIRPPAAARD